MVLCVQCVNEALSTIMRHSVRHRCRLLILELTEPSETVTSQELHAYCRVIEDCGHFSGRFWWE